jgi:hypothetical protein
MQVKRIKNITISNVEGYNKSFVLYSVKSKYEKIPFYLIEEDDARITSAYKLAIDLYLMEKCEHKDFIKYISMSKKGVSPTDIAERFRIAIHIYQCSFGLTIDARTDTPPLEWSVDFKIFNAPVYLGFYCSNFYYSDNVQTKLKRMILRQRNDKLEVNGLNEIFA